MKQNKQNQSIPLPTMVMAACAGVVAFLLAPLLGKLALAVITSVIVCHATRHWKMPQWLQGKDPNNNNKKGGEPKW
jgi:hypothetical protein